MWIKREPILASIITALDGTKQLSVLCIFCMKPYCLLQNTTIIEAAIFCFE
jgi:hypothetical protein